MRPRIRVARRFALATGADTWSTIRWTPWPSVAASTASGQAGSALSMARSAPYSASLARRSALVEVPITRAAPISLATCKPISPTPELAPWISTAWPRCIWPLVTSASCIVCSAIGSVAACSQPMLLSGSALTRPQSVTAYSA